MEFLEAKNLVLFGLIILLFVTYKFFSGKRQPPTKTFKCARCSKVEPYGNRTINAWRSGYKKIYCQSCHAKWLNNRSPDYTSTAKSQTSSRGSGCLGALLGVLFIPIGLLFLF